MKENSEYSILIPEYMKKFKCIGPTCEDTCCKEFDVLIDKKTYKLYRNERSQELKVLFSKYISRNKNSDKIVDANYAKVNVENNRCPFLNEDKLCKIYLAIGEGALSVTCHSYPRIYNLYNQTLEKSAILSCPEVARLALLNESKMTFEYIRESEDKKYISKRVVAQPENQTNYFWDIRSFAIDLLQNRDYSIDDRLIILGLFIVTHDEYIENGQFDEIGELITEYQFIIDSKEMQSELSTISPKLEIQISLLKEITDMRNLGDIKSQSYLKLFAECLKGMNFENELNIEELGKNYQKIYKENYSDYMDKKLYIYENYLVNYVFQNMFPFGEKTSAFDSYTKLVINYALIKMHLVGLSKYYGDNFNDEVIIRLIQSYSKVFAHNNKFFELLIEILKVSSDNLMMYLSIMIRN